MTLPVLIPAVQPFVEVSVAVTPQLIVVLWTTRLSVPVHQVLRENPGQEECAGQSGTILATISTEILTGLRRRSATNYQTVLLTVSAKEYPVDVWTPALIMW